MTTSDNRDPKMTYALAKFT